ncbi:unnamed protein product [Candidula unifasciata]|uniref:Transcription elongation factor, mitochondrial n=1 Tax=Candidula unifasciata TaxID=100452 RepID=A0A8S3ZWC9_9EUPU|nr:unnamed protein product [Candidula unifasciata]
MGVMCGRLCGPGIHTESAHRTDEDKILHYLNTLSAQEMRQEKNISLRLSELLCQYRELNGPFQTLKDVEKIKYIGFKSFKTLCERLTAGSVKTQKVSMDSEDSFWKYISPELTPQFIQSIATVTSLEFSLDSVYFSTITQDLQVLDWNHINLLTSNCQKQTPSHILDEAVRVYKHLPKSSIILIENRVSRKITTAYLQYLLFIARLQMALQTLINEDLTTSGQHKVFHIKDSFVTKSFHLRIGGERVSGQNIVQQIQEYEFSPAVSAAAKFWHRYNELDQDVVKERYANCLLLSLAFCRQVFVNKSLSSTDRIQQ